MNIKETIGNVRNAIAVNHAAKSKENRRAVAVMAVLGLMAVSIAPDVAMAAPWDSAASSILSIFTSGLTRTIAIIAMIALGIAALAGKLSWDWAIKIIIGIVLIFGSTAIVDYIISASSS